MLTQRRTGQHGRDLFHAVDVRVKVLLAKKRGDVITKAAKDAERSAATLSPRTRPGVSLTLGVPGAVEEPLARPGLPSISAPRALQAHIAE